jgi:hypothetical protein
MRVVSLDRSDRSGRTRNERHHRAFCLNFILRLVINAALIAVIAKDRRRELATRVAVDAGGIDEKISRHVLR